MVDSSATLLNFGISKKSARPDQSIKRARRFRNALVSTVCAGALGMFAPAAQAQNATWTGDTLGLGQWENALSWSGGVPTGTATFGAVGLLDFTAVGFLGGQDATIQNMVFTSAAPLYTFNIGSAVLGQSTLTITGNGITNNSAFQQIFNVGGLLPTTSAILSFTGAGTTAANSVINVGNNGVLNFSGSSTAATSIINTVLDGVVNFSGSATGGAASLNLVSGALLNLSGLTSGGMTLGSLSGAGAVTLGANTLSLGATNASMVFNGPISGTGGLQKTGTGTLTLGGNNTFTGGLDLAAGRIRANATGALGVGEVILGDGTELLLGASGNYNNTIVLASGESATLSVAAGVTGNILGGLFLGDVSLLTIGSAGNTGTLVVHGGSIGVGVQLALDYGILRVGDAAFGNALATATLTVGGSGTLNLNGFNANVGLLAGSGFVSLGGNTLTVGGLGVDTSFGGVISGTGSLVKTGSGSLTLTGNNTLSGGVNLSAGTIVAGNNGALGTGTTQLGAGTTLQLNDGITLGNAITLNGNASLDVEGTDSGALTGIITGGFGLTKTGIGTLTLTGNNTFTGGLNLDDGTVIAGSLGALGTGAVILGDGTELQLAASGDYNNAISLEADAFATLAVATGVTADLVGGLSVASGNFLIIGSAGNAGELVVHSGGSLGAGAEIAVANGVLSVGDAAFGNSLVNAAVNVEIDGALNLNGFDTNLGLLFGEGSVSLGGNSLTVGSLGLDAGFDGAISGTGGLIKVGTGALILTGNNTYTGLTHVVDGMLLVDGSLASSVTVDAGAVLGGIGSIAGDIDLAGTLAPGGIGFAGTLTTGSVTMGAGASLDIDLFSPIAGGSGTGNDMLNVNGDLTLNGILNVSSVDAVLPGIYNIINYTGSLVDNGIDLGHLPIGVTLDDIFIQTVIDGQINIVISLGDQNLQFWNGSQMTADGTIHGGSGTWNASNTNWTNATGTTAGTWGQDFAVFQGTGGTVTVDGNITFSGLQFAGNGYVIEGEAGSLFNAQDNAIFRVDSGISGTINTEIMAQGVIQKVGGGELVLGAANSLDGGIIISGGTVAVTHTDALGTGDVTFNNVSGLRFAIDGTWENEMQVNANTLARLMADTGVEAIVEHLNTSASSVLQFGDATHTGSITALGAGNTLNAFTGIQISGGELVVGDAAFGAAFTQGAMNIAAAGSLDLNGFDFTIASLGGAGTIINNGGGEASLLVEGGVFSGSLEDGSGVLGLNKVGNDTLTLSGTSSYSGATQVEAGAFYLNGGVLTNSHVTIDSGALLGGIGSMAELTAANGSFIAPGIGTVGTLHVDGNFSNAGGSTYMVDVLLNNGGADRLEVGGIATLAGGSVLVSGMMQAGMHYSILSAEGGVDGTFGALHTSMNSDFLTPELVYTETDVTLSVVRNDTPLPGTAGGGGSGGGGGVIGGGGNNGGVPTVGDAVNTLPADHPVLMALLNTTYADAAEGLRQLSGEVYATSKAILMNDGRFGQRLITARLHSALNGTNNSSMMTAPLDTVVTAAVPSTGRGGFSPYPDGIAPRIYDGGTMWAQGYGSWGKLDGTSQRSGFKRDIGGVYVGLDAPVSDWLVGIAGGYSRTTFHSNRVNSSGDADSWRIALYGGTQIKKVNIRLGAQQAWHEIDTARAINFATYSDFLTADYRSSSTHIFADVGIPFTYRQATFEPFAGISYNYLHTGGFVEEGGAAALYARSSHDDQTTTALGVRAETAINFMGDYTAILRGMASWRHNTDNIPPRAKLAFIGSETFGVSGLPFYRDAVVLETGVDFMVTEKVSIGVNYDGQISSDSHDHGVRLNVRAKY